MMLEHKMSLETRLVMGLHPCPVKGCMHTFMYSPFPGNNWGRDSEGEGLGHGPQEEFYGCADVAVTGDDEDSTVRVTSTSAPTTTSTAALTATHSTLTSNPDRHIRS